MNTTTKRLAAIALVAGLSGALAACTSTAPDDTTNPPISEPTQPTEPTDQPTTPDETADEVTMEQAGDIAMNEYGGTVVGVEPDQYNGEDTWSVELAGTSTGDIEVEVSQSTGEILATDPE